MSGLMLLVVIASLAAVGDIWVYKWAKTGHHVNLLISFSSWAISLWLYGLFLRHFDRSLAISFVMLAVIQTVLICLWELVTTDSRWSRGEIAGIVLGILGVVIVELSREKS